MSGLPWVGMFGGVAAGTLGWSAYQLAVQNGRILARLEALERTLNEEVPEGLRPGTVLNDFSLSCLNGGALRLSQLRRNVLLLFVDPDCPFSRELLKELAALPKPIADPMPVIISTGDPGRNREMLLEYPLPYTVLLQEDAELCVMYRVPATPAGYVVDENRRTASGLLMGARAVSAKLPPGGDIRLDVRDGTTPILESHVVRDGLKAGAGAPDFTLPALGGGSLSLRQFRGGPVLLVFWDPRCEPCLRLASQLETLHRQARGPRVVMVSRGGEEKNREMAAELGLSFPIALQQHRETARAYGTFATPAAYLIGSKGTLDSDVAAGGDSILKLVSPAAVRWKLQ